jgi:arylsulfatase A-like enzyme
MESNLIGLTDLAPTFATWAGVLPQQAVNGASLDRLLTSPGTAWRQELLLEVLGPGDIASPEGLFSGVRTQRYVYAEYTTGERELYDLQTDPYQLTNVASNPANAALVAQLSALVATLKSN